MNRISIYGGLGNQMFQYALYRSFKERGLPADLDLSDFFHNHHHQGLDLYQAFRLPLSAEQERTAFFLERRQPLYRNKPVRGILRRLIPWHMGRQQVYREKQQFIFDPAVYAQRSDYLKGTWQCVQYLDGIEAPLRQAFRFQPGGDASNRALAEKMAGCNAVSLHIRRGDFQSSAWSATHHVIKDAAYYRHAVEYIAQRISEPHYFIFSDDMAWTKANLPLVNCTYVEHNRGRASYLDMYLMSCCKHHIIANSTFSWWGAWLNDHPGKMVIMPERWLNGTDCPGIFPADWIKMKVV